MVVKHVAPAVLDRIAEDPLQLERLQTFKHSEVMFGLAYPFLHRSTTLPAHLDARYFVEVHVVRGKPYRVTNQWPERLRPRFVAYVTGVPQPRPPAGAPPADVFADDFVTGGRTGAAPDRDQLDDVLVRHILDRAGPGLAADAAAVRAVLDRARDDLAALARKTAAELRTLAPDARRGAAR
jgi:hypothetical protein